MNITQGFIIFSPERADVSTAENVERVSVAIQWLQREAIPFEQALGSFQGVVEHSFVVPFQYRDKVVHKADYDFQQNSILEVHGDGVAVLRELVDLKPVILGRFTKVDAMEARKAMGWTRLNNGDYYVAK